jgi:hypothetical protein
MVSQFNIEVGETTQTFITGGPLKVTMRLSLARLAPPPVSRGMASGMKT